MSSGQSFIADLSKEKHISSLESVLLASAPVARGKCHVSWCGSFALSTISIVLSPADWYLNTFSFVIFLPDVSDNTINQHSPVEMQLIVDIVDIVDIVGIIDTVDIFSNLEQCYALIEAISKTLVN